MNIFTINFVFVFDNLIDFQLFNAVLLLVKFVPFNRRKICLATVLKHGVNAVNINRIVCRSHFQFNSIVFQSVHKSIETKGRCLLHSSRNTFSISWPKL